MANTALYVVDGCGSLLPAGAAGGDVDRRAGGGARLLGHPELTAEKFVPDAFGSESQRGERVYRTGDRVRGGRTGRWSSWGGWTRR